MIDLRIAQGMDVADYDIPPQDGAEHGEGFINTVKWLSGTMTPAAVHHARVRLLPADRARFERRE